MVITRSSKIKASLCIWASFFMVLWCGLPAAAAQDIMSTRSLAMGGSLRAAPSGSNAVLLNPAGMSLSRAYQIGAFYQYRATDEAGHLNVSVVDSITSRLAAGLFYSYMHSSPARIVPTGGGHVFALDESTDAHSAGLSLSYPIGDIFHIGVTTRYSTHAIEQPEGTPEAYLEETASGVTMDVGGILRLASFNIAAVGYNLVPIEGYRFPQLLGLGAAYNFGTTFLTEFDAVLDFTSAEETKPSFHFGAEFFLAQAYALRAGVMHDTLREATYVTGGLGLVSKVVAVDFGLRQMVEGGAETTLSGSVRIFMQ